MINKYICKNCGNLVSIGAMTDYVWCVCGHKVYRKPIFKEAIQPRYIILDLVHDNDTVKEFKIIKNRRINAKSSCS